MTENDTAVLDPEQTEVLEGAVEDAEGNEVVPDPAEAPAPRRSRAARNAENAEKAVQKRDGDLNKSQAKSLTKKLGSALGSAQKVANDLVSLYQQAWAGRVWIPLGYNNWGEYVGGEFSEIKPNLPVDVRRPVVKELTIGKLNQSAIAEALGVDQKTVSNDIKMLREAGELPTTTSTERQDGGEQASAEGRAPRTVDLNKAFDAATNKLDDAVGRLTELFGNEQFAEKMPEFRTMLREELGRQQTQIAWLLDQLQ